MSTFKTFIAEKKGYELNAQENKQVEDILNTYLEYFDPELLKGHDPKQVYRKSIKDDRILIGTIKYHDLALKEDNTLPVYVSFEHFAADAAYEEARNVIELYFYNFNKLSTIMKRNKIVHELIHAKQHFKKLTPEYRRSLNKRTTPSGRTTIRSERGYFFAPNEYPVQVSSIIHEMDRQYRLILQKLKAGSNVKFWENQRTGFLRLLEQFLRSARPLESDDIPNYLKNEKRFIMALQRNKDNPKYSKYYKDFKQKMYWYYQRLKTLKLNAGEIDNNLPES